MVVYGSGHSQKPLENRGFLAMTNTDGGCLAERMFHHEDFFKKAFRDQRKRAARTRFCTHVIHDYRTYQ